MKSSSRSGEYNIFRWYRAGWGRYTQADPAWDGADVRELNHYTYVAANPNWWSDPLGLKIEVCCRPLAGAMGAVLTQVLGSTHCFVRITEPPLPVAAGQSAGTLSGSAMPLKPYGQRKLIKRFHYPDDQNYQGSNCQTSPDTCERRQCLQNAFRNFPSGRAYTNTGVNSNTLTRSLVAKCGLGVMFQDVVP